MIYTYIIYYTNYNSLQHISSLAGQQLPVQGPVGTLADS